MSRGGHNKLLCHPEVLTRFASLIERRRVQAGYSKGDIENGAMVANGTLHAFRRKLRTISFEPALNICLLLEITEPVAWAIASSGRLPRAVTFEEAVQIADILQVDTPHADMRAMKKRMRRELSCKVCAHKWRTKVENDPRVCPACKCVAWKRGLSPRQLETRKKRSKSIKATMELKRRKAC